MEDSTNSTVRKLARMSDEAFVQRTFVVLFRRSCSSAQAARYVRALRSGSSRHSVWKEIRALADSKDNRADSLNDDLIRGLSSLDGETFLSEAYRRILGRKMDASGLKHYIKQLAQGGGKDRILYSLLMSDEGRARMEHVPSLRRLAEGFRRQFGIIDAVTVSSAMRVLRLEGETFVRSAYKCILGREADSAGMRTYMDAMEKGARKVKILCSLAESEEGRGRQKTIAAATWFTLSRWIVR